MRSGELRWTISLQRSTRTVGAAGAVTETWRYLALNIRALLLPPMLASDVKASRVVEVAESDRAYGRAEQAILTFRVRFRDYFLTVDDRLLFEAQPYQITGISEVGWRQFLDIRCRRLS